MKNLKFLASATLGLGLLLSSSSFADTLTYTITGPTSMSADWVSSGGDLGTMTLTKTADAVQCGSFAGLECQVFGLQAAIFSDWNTVYNQTSSWEMYDIVQKAGGSKVFVLSSASSSPSSQVKNKINAIKALKESGASSETILLKAK